MEATGPPELFGVCLGKEALGASLGYGSTRPKSSLVHMGRALCHPLLGTPLASCHSHMSTSSLGPLLLPCPWTIT